MKKTTGILERHLFPRIGSEPLASILPKDILDAVRRVEARGNRETAHRTLSYASQVFRYGVATSVVTSDPTRDLRGALAPIVTTHRAAITEPEEVGALLRAIDGYGGTPSTAAALKLAPLVFVRPGELRGARWEEFDLDAKEPLWSIPGKRMKMREDHMVPLSTQATAILKELRNVTGPDGLVFPGERSSVRPISDGTLNAALRRLGYTKEQMTAHGFRAVARTLLDERLHVRLDFIEHQSAHAVRDANGRAYNRTTHLDERRKMMQAWADYLDKLRANSGVAPLELRARPIA
jgi:integrase